MKALITGATGFIGRSLAARLESPTVLTRDPANAREVLPGCAAFAWDGESAIDAEALEGREVVFHLAGEPISAGRWTAAKKAEILKSRKLGTRRLVEALGRTKKQPGVLVSASAVGYYGDRGDEVLDEASGPGRDFLSEVCRSWEEAAVSAEKFGMRVLRVRIGVVIGPGGGALKQMLLPFRLGLGGRLGSGRQWFPWVHIDDVVGILLHAATLSLRHVDVLNACGPEPVTNREFTHELGHALHRPTIFPVPVFALRAAFGELADVLLGSQRVEPKATLESGYKFRYNHVGPALVNSLGRRPARPLAAARGA